jgi:hypothetical protein
MCDAFGDTAFGNHIGVVFGDRAKKQMIWPDAGSVITVMADAKTFWDRTKEELPRKTWGDEFYSDRSRRPKPPVTTSILIACPNPATRRFVHICPELLDRRCEPWFWHGTIISNRSSSCQYA